MSSLKWISGCNFSTFFHTKLQWFEMVARVVPPGVFQVFLVRKVPGPEGGTDAGTLYAMKVLKKATLKGQGHKLGTENLTCTLQC